MAESAGAGRPGAGALGAELGRDSGEIHLSRDPESPAAGSGAGAAGAERRRRVHLGLGSNLGDRRRYLQDAAVALRERVDLELTVSPVYETEPLGGPADQGPYLNAVVRLRTDITPRRLLEIAHDLERSAGRVRTVVNGPRTLDVDILLVEGVELHDPDLEVPHPRFSERAFVLAPLEDLDADLVPPDWRERLGGVEAVDRQVRRVGNLFGS